MIVRDNPKPLTREAWLEERRSLITSTKAPAICGVSPWATALSVWLEMRGREEPKEATARMKWGLRAEPMLAEAYEEATGRELDNPGLTLFKHPSLAWMATTVDRLAMDRIVELKTVSWRAADKWGESGTDDCPEHVLVQVHHQMAVLGADLCDVAAYFGDGDFRIYTVRRSEALAASILAAERTFLAMLQEGKQPMADWSHHVTKEVMRDLYGFGGVEITLGQEYADLAREWVAAGETERLAGKRRDAIKAELFGGMKEATLAICPGGIELKRSQVNVKEHVRKESSYIKLSVKGTT